MTRHVLLNNVDHKDLRIITTRSAVYGDDVMCTVTFHREFRNLQAHYPIFFRKDGATGRFQAVAALGFEEGENLFLDGERWDAAYVPMTIERQPFLIGFQQSRDDGGLAERRPVIHVDLDSPRISEAEGEPVFLAHGGLSPYLDRMSRLLHTIHEGLACERGFMDALVQLELLESFVLDAELDDGSRHRLAGFYTINEDRLAGLSGDELASLNASGYLMPVYMAVASLSNIRALIERKNTRLQARGVRAGATASS